MYKPVVIVALLLSFVVACDDDDAAGEEETTDEVVQEEVAEPAEEQEPDQEEGPRVNETETPSDDEIGELPEGIGLAVGESIPEISTQDSDGETLQLHELGEDSTLLVFFYRGGWCPYCNFQIREMTESYEQFAERDVLPVAISVDQVDKAAETNATYEIPFPVLADPELEIHESFNVVYEASEEEVERLAGFGMDLEASSGRDHNSYAIPGVFIIDGEGTIQWAHANEDYSVRPSPEQLLTVIDELGE